MTRAKKKSPAPIPRFRITSPDRPGAIYYTYGPDLNAAFKNADAAGMASWEIEPDGFYSSKTNTIDGSRDLAASIEDNQYAKPEGKK